MSLRIQKGPTVEPLRILLHGVSGIGKTTFAAAAPKALFLTAEDGGGDLDIARLPVDSWKAALAELSNVLREEHDYDTLVIDTVSTLERLCHAHIVAESKAATIDDAFGGYGKGYTAALVEQEKLIAALDQLRIRRRMNVLALCHTTIKKFDDPRGVPYDRYQLAMNEKAAKLWMAWADDVLFANYDVRVKTETATAKKGKARDEVPDRVIYTETRAAYDAKNRHALPADLELSWPAFATAIRWDERTAAAHGRAAQLRVPTVDELRAEIGVALRERNWTNKDVAALLSTHGAAKAADLSDDARAAVIVALRESRNLTNKGA